MKDSNQTFLITGGAGFLGSHLVEMLIEKGNRVICFDNEFRGSFEKIENSSSRNLVIKKGDVRNFDEWPHEFNDINAVFHLAAINGTPNFYSIPEIVLDVNVKGVINALEFVRKKSINYISFASTPEAYGIPKIFPTPESEDLIVPDINNPRWSYGASKIIGEVYCANYAKKYGFKCSILRYNNAYGPRDDQGHVIPDLIKKILRNEKLIVEGTGDETRSFCYVKDSIDAALFILKNQQSNLEVFNVGIDIETKIRDLIKLIGKILEKDLKPIFTPKKNPGTARRIPDITKLKKLGYQPKVSLEEGLKLTIDWHIKKIT